MSTASDSNTIQAIPINHAVTILQQRSKGNWGTRMQNYTNSVNSFTGWLSENFSYSASAEYTTPFQTAIGGGLIPMLSVFGLKTVAPAMTAQLWSGSETPEFSIEVELIAESDPILEIRTPIFNLLKMVTPATGSLSDSSGAVSLQSPGPYIDPVAMWKGMTKAFPPLGKVEQYINSSEEDSTQTRDGSTAQQKAGVTDQKAVEANKPQPKQGSTVDTSGTAVNSAANNKKDDSFTPLDSSMYIQQELTNQISISIGQYLYFPSVVITSVECDFLNQLGIEGWPMQATVTINFRPLFLPTQNDVKAMFGISDKE